MIEGEGNLVFSSADVVWTDTRSDGGKAREDRAERRAVERLGDHPTAAG